MNYLLINKKDGDKVFYNNVDGVSKVRLADESGKDAYYWQIQINAGSVMDDFLTRETASFKADEWYLYERKD